MRNHGFIRRVGIAAAIGLLAGLVAQSTVDGARAATATATPFVAAGSVDQVYATGVTPSTTATLTNATGKSVATQKADSLGGILFRNITPGAGYRVHIQHGPTSGPLTVHNAAAAPWDPGIYHQSIPDNGYTYLTTRDGTQLAIDVHPPTSPAGEPGLPAGTEVPTVRTTCRPIPP